MAINKKLRAWVRYDGKNRVVAGSLILQPNKPKDGKWKELPVYKCCGNVNPNYTLRLLFDDIANANSLVGDAANFSDWNTFFDLPSYGNPFESVVIVGNEVQLTGGSDIDTIDDLFSDYEHLIEVNDDGALVSLNNQAFGGPSGTSALVSISAPNVTYTNNGAGVFSQCYNLVNVYLPNCVTLGSNSFTNCSNLPQSGLTLPFDQITQIYSETFKNCSNLTEVNYSLATDVGREAFRNCDLVTSINLPLTTVIGEEAFYSCNVLSSINVPNVITIGPNAFYQSKATIYNFPDATTIGFFAFAGCTLATSFNLSSCTNLGGTVGDNGVFVGITGNTITLTVPTALMTCNAGNPDGDIVYLQANNTVTIITV
jgi:hypothetical protein